MKRKTIFLITILAILFVATTSFAATETELLNKLKGTYKIAGQNRRLSASEIVQIERYLSENNVTPEQADAVIAKIDETIAYINNTGVKNIKDMSQEQKDEVLGIISDGAAAVNLTVSYDSKDKFLSVK